MAHVDLDAFYASCEQLEHPEYRGRPVVVGAQPGHRGVVAAASYEAREFGIHSAMPIAEACRRCPGAVYLRPDMAKYQRLSRRVFAIFDEITPVVEQASIDEAYLDVSGLDGLWGPPDAIGREIRARIRAKTGLTASVGIGPNRLVAKLASESCKPDGLCVVRPDEVLAFLDPMPVSNLRGLGRRTLELVAGLGIGTVGELRRAPVSKLQEQLGDRLAENFLRQANGIASAEVVPDRARKSISKETTFARDVRDPGLLHDTLRELAASVARTARREGLAGAVVTLKIRFAGFETHTRQRKLPGATQDERVLLATAQALLEAGTLPRKPVRLIGVGISQWAGPEGAQPDLFDAPAQRARDARVLGAIDTALEKFGRPVLQVGMPRKRD